MQRVLVLNATYEPLSIVSIQRAVAFLLLAEAGPRDVWGKYIFM